MDMKKSFENERTGMKINEFSWKWTNSQENHGIAVTVKELLCEIEKVVMRINRLLWNCKNCFENNANVEISEWQWK